MIALLSLIALGAPKADWKPITLSWYMASPKAKMADGTRFKNDSLSLATYREPLGAVLEVRVGKVTQTLVVRDRTAKRLGHRGDLPRDTWKKYGHPLKVGLLKGEYRRIK